jgi:hypothetical protein
MNNDRGGDNSGSAPAHVGPEQWELAEVKASEADFWKVQP